MNASLLTDFRGRAILTALIPALARLLALLCLLCFTVPVLAELNPVHLRCEYLSDPLAVDAAQPRLSWVLESSKRGQQQAAYQILAATSLEKLAKGEGDLWDSGRMPSDQSIQVVYSGRPLASRVRVFWKVRAWKTDDQLASWSQPSFWQMGLIRREDWTAKWIGDRAELPPVIRPKDGKGPERSDAQPATMLRKDFRVAGRVQRAILYASALGVYELRLNGQRVGDHILAPEWTDYHTRVQYQAYDVTSLLQPGENAIGAFLGDGWYAGRLGMSDGLFQKLRGVYGRRPHLISQLEIQLDNGETMTVPSDESWSSTRDGPIRSSDLLDGEVYDARQEMPGWDSRGFHADDWQPVAVLDPAPLQLVAQPNEPIRVSRELRPTATTQIRPGVVVFDFGQNIVGWSRLNIAGTAGRTVTLRYAEMLNADGTIYSANLRSAPQVDHYTLRGSGDEVFEPHFTYHGFRFVEVSALTASEEIHELTGRVFHSASPDVGQFECSDPRLNQLWQNILWTQRANLMSVPTDCPQRDERLGWMGDIQAFCQTGMFNMDLAGFFKKWLQDVRDAQADDGRFADFSPHPYGPNERFSGAPAWADAGVIVPWQAYVNYGDKRLLEQHFDAAKRWVEFVRSKNPDLIWRKARGNDYNDWLNGDTLKQQGWPTQGGAIPKEVFATAFFAHSTELISKAAWVLGRAEDARHYATLFEEIQEAFNGEFVQSDGQIRGDTQAGHALALSFELLPQPLRAVAAKRMVEGVHRYQDHMSTGIQCTHRLMLELTRNGYHDLAWQLLTNRTFPSWGYMLDNGATTIWERWDGYVRDRGFQDPGMNSFNHWAFGAVGEWMFRYLAGINPDGDQPGYRHFIIRPRPVGGLRWAKGDYDSICGHIRSQWEINNGVFELRVIVPVNTTATVFMPNLDLANVRVNGRPLTECRWAKSLRVEDGAAAFEIGSGDYGFKQPRKAL